MKRRRQTETTVHPKRRKRSVLGWVRGGLKLLVGIPVVFLLLCTVHLVALNVLPPGVTSVQMQRQVEAWLSGKHLPLRYDWVPRSRIASHLGHAVIAAEDGRFYSHHGIDWEAVQDAIEEHQFDAVSGVYNGASTVAGTALRSRKTDRVEMKRYWSAASRSSIHTCCLDFTPESSPSSSTTGLSGDEPRSWPLSLNRPAVYSGAVEGAGDVAGRVVRRVGICRGRRRVRGRMDEDRVAVRWGLGDERRSDRSARTGNGHALARDQIDGLGTPVIEASPGRTEVVEGAEDVVQDAFLACWRGAGTFKRERGNARSWLLSIVHHRAVDVLRRKTAFRPAPLEAAGDQPADADTAEEAATNVERRSVRAALQDLPEAQRRTIELAYFGGYTQSELADLMGVPLGTVKGRMRIGLQKMRRALVALR